MCSQGLSSSLEQMGLGQLLGQILTSDLEIQLGLQQRGGSQPHNFGPPQPTTPPGC